MTVIEATVEHGTSEADSLVSPPPTSVLDNEAVEDGVWEAIVRIEPDRWVPAAVSIGRRRTFYAEAGQHLLEAHLLNVNEDLYGRRIRVELATKIRPRRTYGSVQTLTEQLHQDVQKVHEWSLSHFPPAPPQTSREHSAASPEALSYAS